MPAVAIGTSWHIVGTGDFNGDGRDDILWRNTDGSLTNWLGQANGSHANNASASTSVATSWHIAGPATSTAMSATTFSGAMMPAT